MKTIRSSFMFALGVFLSISVNPAIYADDGECVPQGVEQDFPPVEIPISFPEYFPIPTQRYLMSASSGPADEFNPYPYATLELLTNDDPEDVFSYYQKVLPESGYRIVMWENDTGAMGFRVKSDSIDQATISINSYDCRTMVGINVSLLP